MQLRIAEQYLSEFGQLAKAGTNFVVPASLGDVSDIIALAKGILDPNGRARSTTTEVR